MQPLIPTVGTYQDLDGRPSILFERVYRSPVAQVWAALIEPAQVRYWFPSGMNIEPRVGGTVQFDGDPHMEFSTGTVLTWDPPRRLAFTWGGDEVHFDLTAVDHGCRLTLINRLEARNTAARNASGWTVCLAELDKLIAGHPGNGPHSESTLPFRPIYQDYVASGMPSGAVIPGFSSGDDTNVVV